MEASITAVDTLEMVFTAAAGAVTDIVITQLWLTLTVPLYAILILTVQLLTTRQLTG